MNNNLTKNRLTIYFFYFIYLIIFLSISRLALSLWNFNRVQAVNGWSSVLIQGIRIDVATLCFLLFVPMIYSILSSNRGKERPVGSRITQVWLTLITMFLVFMELATPSFIQEYNIRPNRMFIEYLIYPKEVFGMLIKSRLPELFNSTILTSLSGYLVWNWAARNMYANNPIGRKWRPIIAILVLTILAFGARSTLGHRPLNPSMVYFSNDPLVNSLILNSLYSVVWSTKQLLNEEISNKQYGQLSDEAILKAAKNFKNVNLSSFTLKDIPTYSEQISTYQGQPKNLVIILEESLGARFVGSLNGIPLTPSLDKLSKEGLYFSRMFATGTRSVRGIEAIITGFTPTSDRAIIKLDKSQNNFFTIAELLRNQSYHTEFIYGGEAHFDNMKSFFLGNGFDHITEQKDYIEPLFVSTWGVSDEDLFNKAHQKFETLSLQHKLFFSLVFSTSNHEPFEYPDNRIVQYDDKKYTRNNAIQYADWALGQFFDKAKQSNYWQNTIFLIVADHDARSQGVDLVPIKSFHIPALILGNDVTRRIEERIVSQIDMPPTLLSLIGIDNNSPMLGADLSNPDQYYKGRALLQNRENFGFLTEEKIIILQPDKPAQSLKINWDDFSLYSPELAKTNQAIQAQGLAMWGKLAYEKNQYRLPK